MTVSSVVQLLDVLRRYHLLEPAQLAALAKQPPAEPQALARELVKRGWLTPYQANEIFQDRGAALLLGSYVLLEKLGEGGMGAVFKARNWKLGQVVALKLIRKERLANEAAVKRFHREIRAAAQLDHPNIVKAHDADAVGGTHFFVMEYVEGTDLAKIVKQNGFLPATQACEYIRQAALGLQHASERGLVHRDIKPHNLLLSKGGVVKVLDMGLARRAQNDDEGDSSSVLTQEGAVMGTLDYIAPEQALDSRSVDIRADLYSLGCTFYFLLSGRVPFPGGEALAKLMKHRMDEPTPLQQLRPDVSAGVIAVVRKLMAKQPADRFQTPAELAEALAAVLRGQPVRVAAPQPQPVRDDNPFAGLDWDDTDTAAVTTPAERPPVPTPRKRLPLIAAAGIGVVLLVAGILVVRSFLGKPAGTPTSPGSDPVKPGEGYTNSLGMQFVPVAAGKFLMGSPPAEAGRNSDEEVHEVTLTKPFHAGIHEVTVGQFKAFVQDTRYQTEAEKSGDGAFRWTGTGWAMDRTATWRNPGFAQTDEQPVVCVSWNDAVAFCDWLSKKEGKKYGLPTEAQWEYVCRAGTKTKYSFGDSAQELGEYAWYESNAGMKTHPVGQKKPNAWGLYDVHGNVREWTADWYASDYYQKSPRTDPPGPVSSVIRVIRGGSWYNDEEVCRCARRLATFGPSERSTNVGFRVVLR